MLKSRQIWPGPITGEVTDVRTSSVGAVFDRSSLTGAVASTGKKNSMAEEAVPTVEAQDQCLDPHQQAKVPYQIRKGNLPELKIPKRQAVMNDQRPGTVISHPSDVAAKVRQSSRREERKPIPEPQITMEFSMSPSKKEASKMPEGKKNSTIWGKISGLRVCFGKQVRSSQPNQRKEEKPRSKQQKQSATDRNSKGERGDKKRNGRQPAARTNSSEKLQQRAASKRASQPAYARSYDHNLTSSRRISSADNSENFSKQSWSRTSSTRSIAGQNKSRSYDHNLTSSRRISSADISEKGSKQSWSRTSSTRSSAGQNISKLRDYYVQLMLKMAHFSSQHGSGFGAGVGVHVDSDSRSFESEIFRRRCSQEADKMEQWQNSIRPDEWNDAKLGNMIARHFSV